MQKSNAKWYKGNLHTHTTMSDGHKDSEEAVKLYQKRGYDFLAITDHWVYGKGGERPGFLLLSGIEYDITRDVREGLYHIVGVGMEKKPALERGMDLTPQKIIDEIRLAGGIAILAHPAWSLNRAGEAAKLTGLSGCEIYNTISGFPWGGRPYSGCFLDELATRGVFLPSMAADDSHFYRGEEGRSYLMVRAESLTRDGILSALRAGDFYATQGPEFSFDLIDGRAVVKTTPAKRVAFFTDLAWSPDRVVSGDKLEEVSYQIQPGDHFVRAEICDAQGNVGWSSFLQTGT